jgi:hypothetical protein
VPVPKWEPYPPRDERVSEREQPSQDCERLRVPGGWLYRTWRLAPSEITRAAMVRVNLCVVFVPLEAERYDLGGAR